MKDIFAFIGLWVVCMLVLAMFFGDFKTTPSDAAIKEKVELIALTEKSDDAVLRGQAEVAKVELEAIREAKLAALAKADSKADQKQKAIALKDEPQSSTPITAKQEARLETLTSTASILAAIAMAFIVLIFAMRAYRTPA